MGSLNRGGRQAASLFYEGGASCSASSHTLSPCCLYIFVRIFVSFGPPLVFRLFSFWARAWPGQSATELGSSSEGLVEFPGPQSRRGSGRVWVGDAAGCPTMCTSSCDPTCAAGCVAIAQF